MYCKENWQCMAEKDPPFGHVDIFQTSPRRCQSYFSDKSPGGPDSSSRPAHKTRRSGHTIVDGVEKKKILLFNQFGGLSPNWPQSGLAADFIVSARALPDSGPAAV